MAINRALTTLWIPDLPSTFASSVTSKNSWACLSHLRLAARQQAMARKSASLNERSGSQSVIASKIICRLNRGEPRGRRLCSPFFQQSLHGCNRTLRSLPQEKSAARAIECLASSACQVSSCKALASFSAMSLNPPGQNNMQGFP